jgi:hypothetical protein
MADYNSQLPVRSKQDIDERVLIKLQDGDDPAGVGRTQEVSEKKAHTRAFNKDSDGNDQEVLVSQEGHSLTNGDYDATTNKRPSSQGLIVSDRDAAPSESTMNLRPTAVAGEADTICLDIALHDGDGQLFDEDNPLPVFLAESPADEVDVYSEASSVAKDASANHDYTVTAAKRFKSVEAEASGSGKARFELQIEDGAGVGTYTTVMVKFNSTAKPNVEFKYKKIVEAGVIVRLVKTNLDNQAQNLYSQIRGLETN